MGHATAEAVVRAGLELVPFSFTGVSEAVAVSNIGVSGIPVEVVTPERRQQALDEIRQQFPDMIVIDFTLPAAVNGAPRTASGTQQSESCLEASVDDDAVHAGNARFYGSNQLPFVMGTTGGDRAQLLEDTQAAGVYAILAPQMGKQATLAGPCISCSACCLASICAADQSEISCPCHSQ